MEFLTQFLVILFSLNFVYSGNTCKAPERRFSVTALIPARAGSKGIKNKNLSLIGNESLIARTLRIVNECGKFESTWVSTDGKAIADEAAKMTANIHWRDPETATDNATTLSAVKDFLLNHNVDGYVAVIQCTSPFIQKKFLCEAIEAIEKTRPDCLFSVTRSYKLRWTENKDGFVTPINFNPKKRPRRQDWNGELLENGMFYFFKKELVLQEKVLQNERCKIYEIPSVYSLEIDTEFDLALAKAMVPVLDIQNSLVKNETGR